jgi:hypothetical protein
MHAMTMDLNTLLLIPVPASLITQPSTLKSLIMFMVYREIVTVYCKFIRDKYVNCVGEKAWFLNVEVCVQLITIVI